MKIRLLKKKSGIFKRNIIVGLSIISDDGCVLQAKDNNGIATGPAMMFGLDELNDGLVITEKINWINDNE